MGSGYLEYNRGSKVSDSLARHVLAPLFVVKGSLMAVRAEATSADVTIELNYVSTEFTAFDAKKINVCCNILCLLIFYLLNFVITNFTNTYGIGNTRTKPKIQ